MPIISGGAVGAGGITHVPQVSAVGNNGGDLTTTSATFVDLGLSASVAAAAGDVLYVAFEAVYTMSVGATSANFKAVTTTGGNIVNVAAILTSATSDGRTAVLVGPYAVVVGDIAAGLVAVKIQWATGAGTLTVKNSGTTVPRLSVLNLLQ